MNRGTVLAGLLVLGIIGVTLIDESRATALDDYVRAADPYFNWTLIETYSDPDYMLYILNFTSQKWFDGSLFDKGEISTRENHRLFFYFRNILYSTNMVALLMYYCSIRHQTT